MHPTHRITSGVGYIGPRYKNSEKLCLIDFSEERQQQPSLQIGQHLQKCLIGFATLEQIALVGLVGELPRLV